MKAHFYVHVFVSGGRQLHHVCRVDAEEDVQDFRQLQVRRIHHLALIAGRIRVHLQEHQCHFPLRCEV